MAFVKKKGVWVIILLVAAVSLLLGQYVYAAAADTAEDEKITQDLATLSGLSQSTILEIHEAVNDWQTVEENIFVYKRIFSLVPEEKRTAVNLYEQIAKYKAGDLLAIYEFLYENGLDAEKANGILQQYEAGTGLDVLLSNAMTTKEYKVYQPATKEQIRQWLSAGYLAEDILNADAIATAKDLDLSYVLSLKSSKVTWEEIGTKLGYDAAKQETGKVTLNAAQNGKEEKLQGTNYATLANSAKTTADTKKAKLSATLQEQYSLSETDMEGYQKRGFNPYEIQNAYQLAKGSKPQAEKILTQKENGQDWEEIIAQYSSKEGEDE